MVSHFFLIFSLLKRGRQTRQKEARSKSTINVFHRMLCITMTLRESVQHYKETVANWWREECVDDYQSFKGLPIMAVESIRILRHGAETYTFSLFVDFKPSS